MSKVFKTMWIGMGLAALLVAYLEVESTDPYPFLLSLFAGIACLVIGTNFVE
jgi:hypothetical protein